MNNIVKILIILMSFWGVIALANESGWQLEHVDQDIKIYLKNTQSDIKSFRGEAVVNASIDSILSVFSDIDACPEWFHYCQDPMVINEVSTTERYHYLVNTVPFPANNRDFIFHSKVFRNPLTNTVIITMVSTPDYCENNTAEACQAINNSEHVRVRNARGYYLLEPQGNKTTRVTWTQFTDPAGHLPSWLVNLMLKNVPLKALQGLQKKTQEEKYLHSKFNFGSPALSDLAKLERK